MLSKKKRLTTAVFDQVFKSGKVYHSDNFWLRALKVDVSRFAVAVSKKVVPTAVGRNNIKRKVYLLIEKIVPLNNQGLGVIVGVKKNIKSLPLTEIESELSFLLKKVLK